MLSKINRNFVKCLDILFYDNGLINKLYNIEDGEVGTVMKSAKSVFYPF